jgi:hypothetical protein
MESCILTVSSTERAPKARTYSVIPQARLKNFIGREDELQKILSFFSAGETVDPRILVLVSSPVPTKLYQW